MLVHRFVDGGEEIIAAWETESVRLLWGISTSPAKGQKTNSPPMGRGGVILERAFSRFAISRHGNETSENYWMNRNNRIKINCELKLLKSKELFTMQM